MMQAICYSIVIEGEQSSNSQEIKKMKNIMRFTVQVTETSSFRLDVKIEDLASKGIESFAIDAATRMQFFGYYEGINFDNFDFYGKIVFAWQGWID